jgi:hypothetical protein
MKHRCTQINELFAVSLAMDSNDMTFETAKLITQISVALVIDCDQPTAKDASASRGCAEREAGKEIRKGRSEPFAVQGLRSLLSC